MFVCFSCLESDCQKIYRQLFHKELSHLSLQRNTMYILIFSAQREYIHKPFFSQHKRIFSFHTLAFFLLHSIFFPLLMLTNGASFNWMQCYFWDVDCIAHNACLLHLNGAMSEWNDRLWWWYTRFTFDIHSKLGLRPVESIREKEKKFLRNRKASWENSIGGGAPQDEFLILYLSSFFFLEWIVLS